MSLSLKLLNRIHANSCFFSLEFHPPKDENDTENFLDVVTRLSDADPLFVNVTWHTSMKPCIISMKIYAESLLAKAKKFENTTIYMYLDELWRKNSSLALASYFRCNLHTDVLLHMTCDGLPEHQLLNYLRYANELKLQNIFALRGDPPAVNEIEFGLDPCLHCPR